MAKKPAACRPARAGRARGVVHVHRQAEQECDADADAARLVHVPEHQHHGQQVGIGRLRPRAAQVEQPGQQQRQPDEQRVGGQQQLAAGMIIAALPSSTRRAGRLAAAASGSGIAAHRLQHQHVAHRVGRGDRPVQQDAGEAPVSILRSTVTTSRPPAGRRVDAVDARGGDQVAHLHVGIAAMKRSSMPPALVAEGHAALLGARFSTGMGSPSVSSVTSEDKRVDARHLAQHAGVVDHRRGRRHALPVAAVDDDLARERIGASYSTSAAMRAGERRAQAEQRSLVLRLQLLDAGGAFSAWRAAAASVLFGMAGARPALR